MSAPDFDQLERIGEEAERLIAAGTWTYEEYRRLMDEARRYVGTHPEFLEFLILLRDPNWSK